MDLKQWHTYAHTAFPTVSPSAIVVERLEGGIVNSTVRLTLVKVELPLSDISRCADNADGGGGSRDSRHSDSGISCISGISGISSISGTCPDLLKGILDLSCVSAIDTADANAIPSSRPSYIFPDPLSPSFVLKHAPDHMPGDPDTPLSQFRQTAEARALQLLYSDDGMATALAGSGVQVPRVVWHDAARHVLWMSDLGAMRTLTSFLSVDDATEKESKAHKTHSVEHDQSLCASSAFSGDEEDEEQQSNKPAPAAEGPHPPTLLLDTPPPLVSATPYARSVGVRLGTVLAHLHLAAQLPRRALDLDWFKDPAPVGPSMGQYLADMVRALLTTHGHADADTLATRIGLDVSAPPEDALRVWSMVDLWPGSVLLAGGDALRGNSSCASAEQEQERGMPVSSTARARHSTTTTDPPSAANSDPNSLPLRMALVDWEFADETHPGSEIGMLLAHLRGHALQVTCPRDVESGMTENSSSATVTSAPASASATARNSTESIPPPPGTRSHATESYRSFTSCVSRIDDVSQGVVDAYCGAAPAFVRAPSFARMALQSYGRELINSAEFEAAKLSQDGQQRAVAEGAACLRAAGENDAQVELGWLEYRAETGYLLRLLDCRQASDSGTLQHEWNRSPLV